MSIAQTLFEFALRPLLGETADQVVNYLTNHLTDHGQKLQLALRQATDRSWKALELALAGDSWWDQIKGKLTRKEDQVLSQQIKLFFAALPLPELVGKDEFRKRCLAELRQAISRKVVPGTPPVGPDLARQVGSLRARSAPQTVLEDQWKGLEAMAEQFRLTGLSNLAWIVGRRVDSRSLLVIAVQYFFRRAVEGDEELSRGLTFNQLETLDKKQCVGFQCLHAALTEQGERFNDLEALGREISGKIDQVLVEQRNTHDTIRSLKAEILQALNANQVSRGSLRPRDSMSINSEAERRFVKELVGRYRQLPENVRNSFPDILGDLARLQVASGDFSAAYADFLKAVALTPDLKAKAEAHFNAYRAALEQHKWQQALDQLQQAAKLDPRRFEPFPIDRYKPDRILGAGGFGVAFLCQHLHMGVPVVIKTLWIEDLGRDVENVFHEARVLTKLDDPAFVRIWDCGYVDAANKARPYFVMDFFEGQSLEEYVRLRGPIPLKHLKEIMLQVAQALQVAHDQSILHRDVKPANILIRYEDDEWQIKLIDFGLAITHSDSQETAADLSAREQTLVGRSIAGTIDYAAPEQMGKIPGQKTGPHSDVYGFGKSCYFASLGTPDPDHKQRETLPAGWRKFLDDCTAHPHNRLANFQQVWDRLTRLRCPKPPTTTIHPALYSVSCPNIHCRKPLRILSENLGKKIKCPHCAVIFATSSPTVAAAR